MINYYIGVDGGGSGTRVRLAGPDGALLAQGTSGPSGLGLGIAAAWSAVDAALASAFSHIGIERIDYPSCAIGLGLAGVHNPAWAARFEQADPGFGALALASDGTTTLLGAHAGGSGVIVAIGTGSVGQALLADGREREVGGWGFPSGDEAGGGWIGLRAVNHMQQVMDGRIAADAFARDLIETCGPSRAAIQVWLGHATQTVYASLAPLVLKHAPYAASARSIVLAAGEEVARMAHALDPAATLPLSLCGGLGQALMPWLPDALRARCTAPRGDSAAGALTLIRRHLKEGTAHACAS
jgi:glucosamine kinase